MFRRIRDYDVDAIPGTGRQRLASEIHETSAEFERIRASHARNRSPDDIANSLWNLYQKAHGNLAPISSPRTGTRCWNGPRAVFLNDPIQ